MKKQVAKKEYTIFHLENDERWEEVIDFAKIKKGGVDIDDILSCL